MAKWWLGPLQLAALVGTAAALRVQDLQHSRQAPAASCAARGPPLDLAAREGEFGSQCDDLIPRYDMAQWLQEHGHVTPDHPAVFINTGTHESEVFPDRESFLELHGDEWVVALPEYAQSGGAFKNPFAQGKVNATFRQLVESWNHTKLYFSDFKCHEGSLCEQVAQQFGRPALFNATSFNSKNFLVGGPDSGLPFHKHGMTWQGLSMGRKAWYILPPGSMSEDVHDITGPYIFPVRSYHHVLQQRPVGQRPLYCVQHAGEVVYVPDSWWHATMNLDGYEVAYGEKPILRQTPYASDALQRVLSVFPRQAWDTANEQSTDAPMPYHMVPRVDELKRSCGTSVDEGNFSMAEPLRRIKQLRGSQEMVCGLADTAAWAHCVLSGEVWRITRKKECASNREKLRTYADKWQQEAAQLSPALVQTEHKICSEWGR